MALCAAPTPSLSQAPNDCSYSDCGFGIAARWNGLAVVRGQSAERVANLNFLFPRSITRAFDVSGADSAVAWAAAATRRRRVAATFTDLGLALGAASIAMKRRDVAVVGIAMFGISVPLQFAADNALSRAVWWYNRRFTR